MKKKKFSLTYDGFEPTDLWRAAAAGENFTKKDFPKR